MTCWLPEFSPFGCAILLKKNNPKGLQIVITGLVSLVGMQK